MVMDYREKYKDLINDRCIITYIVYYMDRCEVVNCFDVLDLISFIELFGLYNVRVLESIKHK